MGLTSQNHVRSKEVIKNLLMLYIFAVFLKNPFFPEKNLLCQKGGTIDFHTKTMDFFVEFFKMVYRIWRDFVCQKKQNINNVHFTKTSHNLTKLVKAASFPQNPNFFYKVGCG